MIEVANDLDECLYRKEAAKKWMKKAGTIAGPGLFCWLVARIKSRFQGGEVSKLPSKNQTPKPEALKL